MKPKVLFIQSVNHYGLHGEPGSPAAYWPPYDNARIIAVECTRYAQDVVIIEHVVKRGMTINGGRRLLDSDTQDFQAIREAVLVYDTLVSNHGAEIFPENEQE